MTFMTPDRNGAISINRSITLPGSMLEMRMGALVPALQVQVWFSGSACQYLGKLLVLVTFLVTTASRYFAGIPTVVFGLFRVHP
jgi:hypothetical protein